MLASLKFFIVGISAWEVLMRKVLILVFIFVLSFPGGLTAQKKKFEPEKPEEKEKVEEQNKEEEKKEKGRKEKRGNKLLKKKS
jgi:hypothetical protein